MFWIFAKKDESILEVACGIGRATAEIAKRIREKEKFHAIDFTEALIKRARKKLRGGGGAEMRLNAEEIKKQVRKRYAGLAKRRWSCCGVPGRMWAKVLGYPKEIDEMPESVTAPFAGCGNPTALADLKEGEVVLDIGSGAGLDVFLASRRVGDEGRVIGLDFTEEMIELANENKRKLGAKNVEFRLGDMEAMPIEDESIDVVISNCVINLAPDKDKVFQEAYRVLKPGGRMLISDIVTEWNLPRAIRESITAWAGCIAGALEEREYLQKIKDAGFVEVEVVSKARLGPISSAKIRAYKPGGAER
jgi:ubiquinone/menaquinone biosynthesis C-methylase UbiE